MRKTIGFLFVALLLNLVACGNNLENEIHFLEVEFDVPEQIDVEETLELKAVVTYGDELVKDAYEVNFEIWEKGDRDNAEFFDAKNNKDGTYTYEVSFDKDGVFEIYAHTTARDQHTMPLREITVGEGGDYDQVDENFGFQTNGFDMYFMDLENVQAGEEVQLIVHAMLDDNHLANANVRYEIWNDNDEDNRDWVDAKEEANEYFSLYTFEESGTYNIQIHVENDDLHEHDLYTIEVE